mmetsp:Transcript_8777/g.14041  ORF Transcript_8777/g.14041 Transcript_8777/m.14041 type:complete len:80 (+) Transcript_8777:1115-1354(+)
MRSEVLSRATGQPTDKSKHSTACIEENAKKDRPSLTQQIKMTDELKQPDSRTNLNTCTNISNRNQKTVSQSECTESHAA